MTYVCIISALKAYQYTFVEPSRKAHAVLVAYLSTSPVSVSARASPATYSRVRFRVKHVTACDHLRILRDDDDGALFRIPYKQSLRRAAEVVLFWITSVVWHKFSVRSHRVLLRRSERIIVHVWVPVACSLGFAIGREESRGAWRVEKELLWRVYQWRVYTWPGRDDESAGGCPSDGGVYAWRGCALVESIMRWRSGCMRRQRRRRWYANSALTSLRVKRADSGA